MSRLDRDVWILIVTSFGIVLVAAWIANLIWPYVERRLESPGGDL